MICSFECYFKCLCILLYLPNATVATKDIKALQRHFPLSPSTGHPKPAESNKLRKHDNEEKIITKTGSLKYKQPTDHPYVSYDGFGLHGCVEKCLMIGRCNSITYNLQTMKCGLLVASSVTADFRDIETTNTVFTDINGWRSKNGKRCDTMCRGTSRCVKSRKGNMVCVRTVESFVASKGTPFVFKHRILHMSASILHPGYVYYLTARQINYIFMANVRETNAEATTRSHHPSIRVRKGLMNICVGPKTRRKGSVLYGLTFEKKIYHFEEPRNIETNMRRIRVETKSIRFIGTIYGIHVLNGHLCAIGYTKMKEGHLCQLRAHSFYSCSQQDILKLVPKVACSQLEFGILKLSPTKELMYKDTFGFKELSLNYVVTHVRLDQHPYSLFAFSLDASQIYFLYKRDSTLFLGRFYRTLSF